MVAIVSGSSTGLSTGSASVLGQQGLFGTAVNGSAKEGNYVNVATGNVILQDRDDYLASIGLDVSLTRTYNSQASYSEGLSTGWKLGVLKQVGGLSGTVNTAGSRVLRTDGDGAVQAFTYDTGRQAYVSTDGGGAYQSLVFDSSNQRWTWRADHGASAGPFETYDAANGGRIASAGDETGVRLSYSYSAGQLSQITDASGDRTHFDFLNGNVTRIWTEVAGGGSVTRVKYDYDLQNRLKLVTIDLTPDNSSDSSIYTTSYTYAGSGNLVDTVSQSDGSKLTFTYQSVNGVNKVKTVTDALNRLTSYDYSVPGKTTVIDAAQVKTVYGYDAKGQLTDVTLVRNSGSNELTSFTYDDNGNLGSVTDPMGNRSTYKYDANGNRCEETGPDGRTVTSLYDPVSNLLLGQWVKTSAAPSNLIANSNFANGLTGWTVPAGQSVIASNNELTISRQTDQILVSQNVNGLVPGKTYTLTWSGATNSSTSGAPMLVGTTGAGSSDLINSLQTASSVSYTAFSKTFVATQSSVWLTFGINGGSASGMVASFKDLSLRVQDQATAGPATTVTADFLASGLSDLAIPAGQSVTVNGGQVNINRQYDQILVSKTVTGLVVGSTYTLSWNVDTSTSLGAPMFIGTNGIGSSDLGSLTATSANCAGTKTLSFVATTTSVCLSFGIYAGSGLGHYANFSNLSLLGPKSTPIAALIPTEADRYVYDSLNHLRFQVDRLGRVQEFRYNSQGQRIAAIRYEGDNFFPLATYTSGVGESDLSTWVAQTADRSRSARTDYTYDARGLLKTATTYASVDASGNGSTAAGPASLLQYVHDQAGQLLSSIDGNGNQTSFTYDGLGRMTSSTDALLRQTVTTYDDAKNIGITTYANGLVRRNVYDKSNQLIANSSADPALTPVNAGGWFDASALKDAYGNAVARPNVATNTYDATGRLRMSQSAAGQRQFYFYDDIGRTSAAVDADGTVTEYFYNLDNQVSKVLVHAMRIDPSALTDVNGQVLGFSMPAANNADRAQWNTYDKRGRLFETVDANGTLSRYEYDLQGRQVRTLTLSTPITLSQLNGITAPVSFASTESPDNDRVHNYIYDTTGNLVGEIDGESYLTEYVYDAGNHLVEQRRYRAPLSAAQRAATNIASARPVTDPSYGKTSFLYDGKGLRVGVVDPAGYLTETSYDSAGNVAATIRYANTVSYDGRTPLRTLRPAAAADDLTTRYTYLLGQLRTVTDPAGMVTTNTYDALGRLLSTSQAGPVNARGSQRRYDLQGNILAELPAAGVALLAGADAATIEAIWRDYARKYTYDGDGRRTSTTDALGNATLYFYDADGRLAYTVDALGEVSGQVYNAFGQVEKTVRYATALDRADLLKLGGGAVDTKFAALLLALAKPGVDTVNLYSYDGDGHVSDTEDSLHNHTVNTYGAFGELQTSSQLSTTASLSTNAARDQSASTLYDRNGRVRARMDGSRQLTVFTYDENGNVTERIAYATAIAAGKSMAQIGADLKAGTLVADPARDARQRFVYDQLGNLKASFAAVAGNSAGVTAWSVSIQSIDQNGRLLERTEYASTLKVAVPTVADLQGVTVSASDAQSRYFYDADGRLKTTASLQRKDGASSVWTITDNQYDDLGNLIASTRFAAPCAIDPTAASVAQFVAANQAPALADSAGPVNACTRQVYDAAGRVIASAVAQGYETVNGKATLMWAVTTTAYDRAGNVKSQVQLASKLGGQSLANGNAASAADYRAWIVAGAAVTASADRITSYTYDALNRLATTTDPLGAVTRQIYDPRGNVVQVIAYAAPADPLNDRTSWSVYDADNRLVFEIDAKGSLSERKYDAMHNVVTTVSYANPVTVGPLPPSEKDIRDQLIVRQLADPAHDRTERFVYDQNARLRYAIDGMGNVTERVYDALGQVKSVRAYDYIPQLPANSPLGDWATALLGKFARTESYTYDAAGNRLSATDALGKTETYGYDALGRRNSLTNRAGATWTYDFDGAGRVIKETAPAATVNSTSLAFNSATGKWDSTLNAVTLQTVTTIEYDAFGHVSVRTESKGQAGNERVTRYFYDAAGRQVRTERPAVARYNPADNPLLASAADESARNELAAAALVSVTVYDVLGNAIASQDAGGRMSYKAYDKAGQVRYEIDASGYVSGYERNSFGQVTRLTRYAVALSLSGAAASRVADIDTALLAKDHSADRTLLNEYDQTGRVTRTTEALVSVYDPAAAAGSNVYQSARTTAFSYNSFGEVWKTAVYGASASGAALTPAQETYAYFDAAGRLAAKAAVVGIDGATRSAYLTTYAYDAAGHLTGTTEYAKAYTLSAAALLGQAYTLPGTDGSDRVTSYHYDDAGRRDRETQVGVVLDVDSAPVNRVTSFAYDNLGNLTSTTDAAGTVTRSFYDSLGRVTAVATGAAAGTARLTEYKLDTYGNVVQRIDYANGGSLSTGVPAGASAGDRKTSSKYDLAGRVIQVVDAEGNARFTSYDAYGNVAKQWQRVTGADGGKQIAFQVMLYDGLGRLIEVRSPDVRNAAAGASAAALVSEYTDYNSFGDVLARRRADSQGMVTYAASSYDKAGRQWLSNEGDGDDRVTLFDAYGNATVQIVGANAPNTPGLRALTDATAALATTKGTRTTTRYDLLGHTIDSVKLGLSPLPTLQREGSSWVVETAGNGDPDAASLIVIGGSEAADGVLSARYRLLGASEWLDGGALRLQRIDGYTVFSTIGLAPGTYEFKTSYTPPGKGAIDGPGGIVAVAATASKKLTERVIALGMALLGKAPTPGALDDWMARINRGATLAEVATLILDSAAGKARLTGTSSAIVEILLYQSFGMSAPSGTGDTAAWDLLTQWTAQFDLQTPDILDNRGQAVVDMLVKYQAVLANGAAALRNYMVDHTGSDAAVAATLLTMAKTDPAGAIAEGTRAATAELPRLNLARLYAMLLGRVPDKTGFDFWLGSLTRGENTLAMVATGLLNSLEGSAADRTAVTGPTIAQYNEQLVTRTFQGLLGRTPSAAEASVWLNKLNAAAPADKGDAAAKLCGLIAAYTGTDAAMRNLRTVMFDKAGIGLAVMQAAPTNDVAVARAIADAMGNELTLGAAVDKAVATLAAQASNAAAAGAAAAATPFEELRAQLSRLYVAILRRAPDYIGMEFWASQFPGGALSPSILERTANELLNSSEAKQIAGLDTSTMSDAAFVRFIFANAGGLAPADPEVADWTIRLATSSRGKVAIDITNAVLNYSGTDSAHLNAKASYANLAGIALTYGQTMEGNDLVLARELPGRVLANGIGSTIDYAFGKTVTAAALALNTAGQAGSSLTAQALLGAKDLVAARTLSAQVLTAAQLYVGVLKRGNASYAGLDLRGLVSMTKEMQAGTSDAALAQWMFESAEAQALWPVATTAAPFSPTAFVTQLYNQLLNRAPTQAELDTWVPQASSAAQRGQVAVGVLRSLTTLANASTTPDATLLQLKGFETKVTAALAALNTAASSATALVTSAQIAATDDSAANTVALSAEAAVNAAISTASGMTSTMLTIARLYVGVLNRSAIDNSGFYFWTRAMQQQGVTAESIVNNFLAINASLFAGATTPELFVNQIYQQVLGRPRDASETFWVDKLKVQGYSRAWVASEFINSLVNYPVQTSKNLTEKAVFDQRVSDAMAGLKAGAGAAASATQRLVDSTWSDRQSAMSTESTSNARVASTATTLAALQTTMDSGARSALMELRCALGQGSVDQLVSDLGAGGSPSLQAIAGAGLSLSDRTSFYTACYSRFLGRAPDMAGLNWWVAATSGNNDANYLAYDFFQACKSELNGGNAQYPQSQTLSSKISGLSSALAAARDDAQTAYNDAYGQWQSDAWSASACDSAWQDAVSMNQIAQAASAPLDAGVGIETKTVLADTTRATELTRRATAASTLATAVSNSGLALDGTSSGLTATAAAAALVSTTTGKETAMALGGGVATAVLAMHAAQQAIDAVQATHQLAQAIQIYALTLGRAPTPGEAQVAMSKLKIDSTGIALANELIAANASLLALSNDAFVTTLYQNALGRTPDATGLRFWSDSLAGAAAHSRGQLVRDLIASLTVENINDDTQRFDTKVKAGLDGLLVRMSTTSDTQFGTDLVAAAAATAHARAALVNAATLTPAALAARQMTQLYVLLLNRPPEATALSAGIVQLTAGAAPATIAQSILASAEIQPRIGSALSNADFVQALYTQGLGRPADAAELARFTAQLGTSTRAQVVLNLIADVMDDGTANPALPPTMLRIDTRNTFAGKVTVALAKASANTSVNAAAAGLLQTAVASTASQGYVDAMTAPLETTGSAIQTSAGKSLYTVDRWGNVLVAADARNANWTVEYKYGANNRVLDEKHLQYGVVGAEIKTRYDAMGRVAAVTDARNFTNASYYDFSGNLVKEVHADGGIVSYQVDLLGQRLSSTVDNATAATTDDIVTTYGYDKLGHLSSRTSAPTVVYYVNDLDGNGSAQDMLVSAAAGVNGQPVVIVDQYQYDELGRRIVTRNTNTSNYVDTSLVKKSSVSSVRYDLGGNVVSVTDATGATTLTFYDNGHHKIGERVANDTRAAGTPSMTWVVDAAGRVTSHTDLGGHTTSYTYNGAGQLATQGGSGGQNLVYSYDELSGKVNRIEDGALHQVSTYAYDRAGNRIAERMVQAPTSPGAAAVTLQDQRLRYDAMGRLSDLLSGVAGANYKVHYDYDANGNRLNVNTDYTDENRVGKSVRVTNTYDAMNRQTGIEGSVTTRMVLTQAGPNSTYSQTKVSIEKHVIAYNGAGSRVSDIITSATTGSKTETYEYDSLGRLSLIRTNGSLTGFRHYDGAGFVVESSDGTELRASRYDAVGRLLRQRIYGASGRSDYKSDIYYTAQGGASYYDAAGYLSKYITAKGARTDVSAVTHSISYTELRDTQLETSTTVSDSSGTTTKTYDVNGHLDTVDVGGSSPVHTKLASDAAGHVLLKTQANNLPNDTTLANVVHTLMADGEFIGNSDWKSESFSASITPLSSAAMAASSTYVVRAGDTLQSIAKAVWGDASLWWLIADANGIGSVPAAGIVLRIPQRVNTVHNDYQTFTPYNAADAVAMVQNSELDWRAVAALPGLSSDAKHFLDLRAQKYSESAAGQMMGRYPSMMTPLPTPEFSYSYGSSLTQADLDSRSYEWGSNYYGMQPLSPTYAATFSEDSAIRTAMNPLLGRNKSGGQLDPDPLGSFIQQNEANWANIAVNAVDDAFGDSPRFDIQDGGGFSFPTHEEHVATLRDFEQNAGFLPVGGNLSALDRLRASEIARIKSEAQGETLTWDPEVGGYRNADNVLRIEISGVNRPSPERNQLPEDIQLPEENQIPARLFNELMGSGTSVPDEITPRTSLFNPGVAQGVYLGARSATEMMYTRSPAVGSYGNLTGSVPGYQAHHLNQNAVYKTSIAPAQGLSILLRGNAFTERGSPHFEAHASLERWWDNYRGGGRLDRQLPTNAEFGRALTQSLIDGGMSPADAATYSEAARQQRLAAGQADEAAVPRLPRRISQPGGTVVDADLWAARGLAKNFAVIGRSAIVMGAAMDGYSLYSQYKHSVQTRDFTNTYREGIRITGGWAGAAAVGAAGAEFGAGFGMAFTPVGAVVGGFIGGIIGGAIGYFGGSYAAVGIANDTGLLRQSTRN